jgi:hypothetical protein
MGISAQECFQQYGYSGANFDLDASDLYGRLGVCKPLRRAFKLVDVDGSSATLLDTSPIDDGIMLSDVFVGDDRVFATTAGPQGYRVTPGRGDAVNAVMVVGGLRDGALQRASFGDEAQLFMEPLAVAGKRLILSAFDRSTIDVLDATNLEAMTFTPKGELASYVTEVEVTGDAALCSLGEYGLQVIDLGE